MNKKTLSVLVCTLVVSTMGMLVLNNSNQSSAAGGLSVVVSETGKAPGSCVKVPGGNTDRYFTYNVRSTNNSNQTLQINTAVFHSNQSGCASYNGDPGVGGEILGGQLVYQPQQVGDLLMRYDTAAYTCGRTQYDASYNTLDNGWSADLNTTYANVFIGVVVDYGVDCPAVPIPASTGTVIVNVLPNIPIIQKAANYTTGLGTAAGWGTCDTWGCNGWNGTHTWNKVPAGQYTVKTDQVSGYTVTINSSTANPYGPLTLLANQMIQFDILYTPVAAPAPTPVDAVINASPSTICAGQSTLLSWNASANTTSVSIDQGIGSVALNSSRTVSPAQSTIYTLTAQNATSLVTRTVMVTVNTCTSSTPTPAPTPAPTPVPVVCPAGTTATGVVNGTLICRLIVAPTPTPNPIITNTNTNNPVITNTNNPVFNNNPVITVSQPTQTQQPYYYQYYTQPQYYPVYNQVYTPPVITPVTYPYQQTLSIQKFGRNISRGGNTNLTSVNARAGDTIEFDIIVTAPTNAPLYNVVVSDTLPAGLTYSVRSASLNNIQTADGITYGGINIGTVSSGQQVTIKFFATVNQGFGAQTLVNTASARADNVSLVNSQPVSVTINSILSGALRVKTGPTENAFALAGFGGLISSVLYVVKRKGLRSLINFV